MKDNLNKQTKADDIQKAHCNTPDAIIIKNALLCFGSFKASEITRILMNNPELILWICQNTFDSTTGHHVTNIVLALKEVYIIFFPKCELFVWPCFSNIRFPRLMVR